MRTCARALAGVRTLCSRFMLLQLDNLLREEAHLRANHGVDDAMTRVFFDSRCALVTPYHRLLVSDSSLPHRRPSRHRPPHTTDLQLTSSCN